jgi:dihydrofolate reductase
MCKQHLPHRLEHTLRNIIVSVRVTLDNFIAGPQGEMDWMEEFFDEALATYESEPVSTADTKVFGRVTYQGFESYWPQGCPLSLGWPACFSQFPLD